MSFQPIIPAGGLVGWRFLQRTLQMQNDAFQKGPSISRDTAYFEAKINTINTPEELVGDHRLLRVALGAFGLQDDLSNKYFIRKILEEGVLTEGSLANRLADDRYKNLSKAFGFGDFSTPRTKLSEFGGEITDKFRQQQFELAVGDQDESMRLALYAERELQNVVTGQASEDTKWFRIMGTPPLRAVFEAALGLPTSIGQLNIDKQLDMFKDSTKRKLGIDSLAEFLAPEAREKLVQTYMVRSQISAVQTASAGSIALTLLQNSVLPTQP